jgi:hypothetical protein
MYCTAIPACDLSRVGSYYRYTSFNQSAAASCRQRMHNPWMTRAVCCGHVQYRVQICCSAALPSNCKLVSLPDGRRGPEGFIGAGRKRDATYLESNFRNILEAFGERGALVSGCEAREGHAWEETAFLGVHLCERFSFIWSYLLRG